MRENNLEIADITAENINQLTKADAEAKLLNIANLININQTAYVGSPDADQQDQLAAYIYSLMAKQTLLQLALGNAAFSWARPVPPPPPPPRIVNNDLDQELGDTNPANYILEPVEGQVEGQVEGPVEGPVEGQVQGQVQGPVEARVQTQAQTQNNPTPPSTADVPKILGKETKLERKEWESKYQEVLDRVKKTLKTPSDDQNKKELFKAAKKIVDLVQASKGSELFFQKYSVKGVTEGLEALDRILKKPAEATPDDLKAVEALSDAMPDKKPFSKNFKIFLTVLAVIVVTAAIAAAIIFTGGLFAPAIPLVGYLVAAGLAAAKGAIIGGVGVGVAHGAGAAATALGGATGVFSTAVGGATGLASTTQSVVMANQAASGGVAVVGGAVGTYAVVKGVKSAVTSQQSRAEVPPPIVEKKQDKTEAFRGALDKLKPNSPQQNSPQQTTEDPTNADANTSRRNGPS